MMGSVLQVVMALFPVRVAAFLLGVYPSSKPANAVFQEFNAGEKPHREEGT